MTLNYFCSNEADHLNEKFQSLLKGNPVYSDVSADIFLFCTEECHAKDREHKLEVVTRLKGRVEESDLARIDKEMWLTRSITPLNCGVMDLRPDSPYTRKLNQIGIDFLLEHSGTIDFITGFKDARMQNFEVPGRFDVLEFGKPLHVRRLPKSRQYVL